MNLYFTFLLLLISPSIFTECSTGLRAKFGDHCDKSLRCDSLASLTCQNSTCGCIKPDSMIFDPIRESCVALAGEKCKFTVVEEYRSWLEEVSCVQNSRCDSASGICVCESTFIEYPNGTCIPRKLIGEGCNETSECRSDLHLSCVNSECKCDPEKSIYSFSHGQCVGRGDNPCLNDLCTPNAICRGYYGEHTMDSYEEYSGEDTKCICETGYTMSPDGLCQVGYDGPCDFVETQCLNKFKCKEGKCSCPYEGHQVYVETFRDCLSLVGGPCSPPKTNFGAQNQNGTLVNTSPPIYCVKPAVCKQTKGKTRYECTCIEGTIENEERRCDLSFGRICQTEKDRSIGSLKCDPIAPLFCIEGTCQCEDDLKTYDVDRHRCRGLVGSDCNLRQELKSNEQDEYCIDGAQCIPFRASDSKGKCQCNVGFVETESGTCSPVINKGMPL